MKIDECLECTLDYAFIKLAGEDCSELEISCRDHRDITAQQLDEIMSVGTSLRIHCQNTKSATKAISIIAEKTGLPKKRVKEILVNYLK